MKRIIRKVCMLCCAASLITMISSCQDWLDMPSKSAYDSTSIFTSVDRAEMATKGAYSGLWVLLWNYYVNYGTDEMQSSEGLSGSKNCVGNYVYTTGNVPGSEFNSVYTGIAKANNCIKQIPLMDAFENGTATEKARLRQYLGECLAIRAIHYWNLIRYWGDVPYITLPQEDYDSFYSSRTSRDVIYDGIIADMQKAIEYLPWYSESGYSTPERITKNAAYGFLARISLYAAGYSLRWDLNTYDASTCKMAKRDDANRVKQLYQIASDACQAVITKGENTLNPSFEAQFRTYAEGKYYPQESMFEYAQYGSQMNSLRAGYSYGMRIISGALYGKCESLVYYQPTLYYSFADGDSRRDVSCPNYEIAADGKRTMTTLANRKSIGKWRVNWRSTAAGTTSAMYQNINFALLRYSDVLLMYAEAQNELNGKPTASGIAAYETVRKRAFGNNSIGTTPTDYDGFFKAIVNERKYELAFEGTRRTDLIRWNLLGQVVNETKTELTKMYNRQAPYQNLPEWVAYPNEYSKTWQDPSVTLKDFIEVKPSETATFKCPAGYTLLKDYITGLKPSDNFVANFARGYEANNVELFPIAQSIMDVNKGLAGQQHPKY